MRDDTLAHQRIDQAMYHASMSHPVGVIARDQKIYIARIGRSASVRAHDFDIDFRVDSDCFGVDYIVELFAFGSGYTLFQVVIQRKANLPTA